MNKQTPDRQRFRRRTWIAVLAVLLLAGGLLGGFLRSVRRAQATIRTVQAAGGAAYLSYQIRDGRLVAGASPDLPAWVAANRPSAAAYVHSLAYIDLRGPHFGDEHLPALSGAPWLQWLALSSSQVTDAGISQLPRLTPRLERLELENTPITDESVATLANLGRLQWLFLDGTGITAEGLDRLQRLLPYCRIDTAGPIVEATPGLPTTGLPTPGP